MTAVSSEARVGGQVRPGSRGGAVVRQAGERFWFILIPVAAFGLYWLSSLILEARNATTHFAGDPWFYAQLASSDVLGRIANNYEVDRIFRFHPTTVVLAAGWMKLLAPLTPWVSPLHLLKAMFAAVGAVGVWAAMRAFAAVVPRRYAALLSVVYACSLSVWYFSSIEESKIVSATLAALYIATYLNLRQSWTTRGAVLLTAILLAACLNETVAAFLVVIPVVDTLVQRGWDLRGSWWIGAHALASPVAIGILEGLMRLRTGPAGAHPEGANHFSMLLYYISQNYYGLDTVYEFALRWLLFSVAAPSQTAPLWADPSINYGGDFEPLLTNYLSTPVSSALVAVFLAMLVAAVLPRYRQRGSEIGMAGILLALLAYAALRGAFFLVFIPYEAILFSPSVVLAYILMIGIPFAASSFPFKGALLAAFALLLFTVNGAFIIGP